jgi:hypothetical protein
MTNWRPITSAPKDGREVTVRRVVHGQAVYKGTAVWRPDTDDWIDPVTSQCVPEPTHWKALGAGTQSKAASVGSLFHFQGCALEYPAATN